MIRNRTARPPLRRKLLPVLVIFTCITVTSLALTFVALAIQSSVRGYVAGEGIWSKAQRDAVFMLQMYGRSRNGEYLRKFEAALAVPLGDRTARLELQKRDYDHAVATRGFLDGGNHPEDVPGMIRLFRCCAKLSYLQRAVDYWSQGDVHIVELQRLAHELRAEIESRAPSAQRVDALLGAVAAVNDSVRPLEAAFTETLGDAARWVTRLLFLVTASVIVLLIVLGAYTSWRILNGIRQSEEQYRALLNTASDALIVVDRDTGTVLEVNERAEQMTGNSALELIGSRYADFIPSPQGNPADVFGLEGDALRISRREVRQPGGKMVPVEVNFSATEWGDRPARLAIIRDITERIKAERQLRVAANAMTNMAEGVVITDARRRIVSVNPAFTSITGYTEAEVIGTVPRYPLSRHDDAARHFSIWRAVHKTGHWQGEIWNRRKSGEAYPELLSISGVLDENGKITHYVGVFNDISAQKDYEQRLQHLAHHDPLTQLPNRATFESQCKEALDGAAHEQTQMALLFIDLDGFKPVNDTYGHAIGDLLLKTVAERIKNCVRQDDAVARVGGDEFAVLLEAIPGTESATLVARKLLKVLSATMQCGGHEVSVSASIGISFFPQDAANLPTLLTNADTAMYQAKNQGRNNYQIFSPGMAISASSRLILTNSLRHAVRKKEFEVYYQPCVDLSDGEITSIEALLRWRHPELGPVSPAVFIPLAEEIGLIDAISEWVLTTVCRQGMEWYRSGVCPVPIAVNVSPRNFWDPELPANVARILKNTGWRPEWLCLEITESTIMHQEGPEKLLAELHAMGIRLAIDDFGIGYSSLSYLKHFSVHYLKIDRFFTSLESHAR